MQSPVSLGAIVVPWSARQIAIEYRNAGFGFAAIEILARRGMKHRAEALRGESSVRQRGSSTAGRWAVEWE